MVIITKCEKLKIKERFPKAHIAIVNKGKSRQKKYYCVEDTQVMDYLNELRNGNDDGQVCA